ncbi:MAG: hypothetical protein ACTIOL_14525 [Enterococcus sp.]
MEETTKEQNKIRRVTLLISVLLIVSSLGSYLVYQHFYQPELQVTFVSKKVLPKTGTTARSSRKANAPQTNKKSTATNSVSKELEHDPLNQELTVDENRSRQAVPMSSAKIFKLSDRIEVLP